MTSYIRSVSTTWEWRMVKIERAAGPESDSARRARKALPVGAATARRTTTVSIRYRGGPEAWWELSSCGRRLRLPGHTSLHDALTWWVEGRPED